MNLEEHYVGIVILSGFLTILTCLYLYFGIAPGNLKNYAVEKIEELKEPGQSLAVFPAGIILNYWTRMPSPTHLYSYNPTNLSATGRAAAQDRFIRNPPDWIILYDSDASLGRGPRLRFGLDYAQPLMAWIQTHYTPQFQAAPPDRSTYGMVILRRNRTAS
jgi:hypothetical protein